MKLNDNKSLEFGEPFAHYYRDKKLKVFANFNQNLIELLIQNHKQIERQRELYYAVICRVWVF